MESVTKSFSVSTPSVAAPVSRPRPTIGTSISSAVKRALSFFRSDDGPPDIPGAVGASDRELALLGRYPIDWREFDDSREVSAAMLMAQLGSRR
jgi:hypothetical protein